MGCSSFFGLLRLFWHPRPDSNWWPTGCRSVKTFVRNYYETKCNFYIQSARNTLLLLVLCYEFYSLLWFRHSIIPQISPSTNSMTTIVKLYLNGTPKCSFMVSSVPIALSKEIIYIKTFKIVEFLLFLVRFVWSNRMFLSEELLHVFYKARSP